MFISKCTKKILHSGSVITKFDRGLLENVTILQTAMIITSYDSTSASSLEINNSVIN